MAAQEPGPSRHDTDSLIQDALDRHRAGDPHAKNDLLSYAKGQLERMSRKMLRGGTGWADVQRWEQTDDVVQGLMMRMSTAIEKIPIASVGDFFRLASRHICWELKALRDHHLAAKRLGSKHESDVQDHPKGGPSVFGGHVENKPARRDAFAEFSRFLDEIETVSEDDLDVLGLIIIHAHTYQEAADRLGMTLSTFKRRYSEAVGRLRGELAEDFAQDFAQDRANKPNQDHAP